MKELARRVLLALLILASTAYANPYPSKPIKIIVPWPAGGIVDARMRMLGDRLSKSMKQQVIVENKPGASGTVGAQAAARAAPDGYTLFAGSYIDQAAALGLFKQLPYDPERDFVPIANLGRGCLVLVANKSLGVSTIDDLIALARASAGKLSYASGGAATPQHLLMEQFKRAAKVDLEHIPYKGGGPALQDVVAGHVPVMFEFEPTAFPHIRSGKLVPLMTGCHRRLDLLPDVPSSKEAGLPSVEVRSWAGLFAPAGTPQEIVQTLNTQINRIIAAPDVRSHLTMSGSEYPTWTAEEFADFIRRDRPRWIPILRDAGIQPQ